MLIDERRKANEDETKFKQTSTQPQDANGTIVYCQFYDCVHNLALEPKNKKTLTDFRPGYDPLFPKEAEINGYCGKEVIVIKSPGNVPTKFPNCFQFSNKKDTHGLHWANNLDRQGNAIGGNIDSQNTEHGKVGYV